MPRQPDTLFELHTQQQPFTLAYEHETWHVTFPGHRCELDVHGSRIEAQAIARCYHSLYLAPGAPFAYAGLSECEMLDLAEREAAIEIEVQQRRMHALLYGATGDGALPSVRVEEPPARYQAGGDRYFDRVEDEFPVFAGNRIPSGRTYAPKSCPICRQPKHTSYAPDGRCQDCHTTFGSQPVSARVEEPPVQYQTGGAFPRHILVIVEEEHLCGASRVAFDSQDWRDPARFQQDVLGFLAWALQKANQVPAPSQVHESCAKYGHGPDQGTGRDAKGRFVAGGQAARECGTAGFWAAIESIQARYPDATYTRPAGDEVHISRSFFYWLQQQGRA